MQIHHPILYFDATGSILKDVKRQKKPFLYSLVMHDSETESIIPLAEFMTTSHLQSNITKYLLSIKNKFDENDILLPKIIVTDFSWALINSVCIIFNNCSLGEYLNWCYEELLGINKLENQKKRMVIPYLCSTHFLKIFIKKSKEITQDENIRQSFLLFFSLILNSVSLKQIENYLINMITLFNSPYIDETVIFSYNYLSKEVAERKIFVNEEDETQDQIARNSYFEYFQEESRLQNKLQYKSNLKKSSPFLRHFDNIVKLTQIDIQKRIELNTKREINNFFVLQYVIY